MVEQGHSTRFVDPMQLDMGFSPSAASRAVRDKAPEIRNLMREAGYDLSRLQQGTITIQRQPPTGIAQLHDMTGALFLHWAQMRTDGDKPAEVATAKLFNQITTLARNRLAPSTEIWKLRETVIKNMLRGQASYEVTAEALQTAARERTHERAWTGVVLPTLAPYGRACLDVTRVQGVDAKIVVTQTSFFDDEVMLPHSHLLNQGFATPLGEGNPHINTLWQPHSEHEIFPLSEKGEVVYQAGEVVAIPPKAIHTIEVVRGDLPGCDLRVLAQLSPDERRELIDSTRFGELSCLHVYSPDLQLLRKARSSEARLDGLYLEELSGRYDMVAFDQNAQSIWVGDGGAWERRQVTDEETGQVYTEGYNRSRELDPKVVAKRLLTYPSPGVLVYSRGQRTDNMLRG